MDLNIGGILAGSGWYGNVPAVYKMLPVPHSLLIPNHNHPRIKESA